MWRKAAVMTALSALGEQFLCWAGWNSLCAHVQFNLGWARGAVIDTPMSLLVNAENWNSRWPLCKLSTPVLGKRAPTGVGRMPPSKKKNSFSWGCHNSSSIDPTIHPPSWWKVARAAVVWYPSVEPKRRKGASEAVSTLTRVFWGWESCVPRIEEFQTGFFPQCLLRDF